MVNEIEVSVGEFSSRMERAEERTTNLKTEQE